MNDRALSSLLRLSIAAVERDTGLSKDALRVWERRYNFPQPERDEFGERIYPADQVEKLRVIKRLIDAGHRPGKIINMDVCSLQTLAESSAARASAPVSFDGSDDVQSYLDLIKTHRIDEFRRALSQSVLRLGLHRFVVEVVAPMAVMVGEAWSRGYFQIFEEHIFTENIQVVMRNAINTIPGSVQKPKILLTTVPNEMHGLGLLMAEAIMSLEGAKCVSLGVQTPIWEIALAATSHHADVVALSYSSLSSNASVAEGLEDLRRKLPASTEIWCGGSSAVLRKRPPEGIVVMNSLDDIPKVLKRWREAHGVA
jgi:DNA-binding transcriptional MerR regulator/methylmalonyl-CoA mutase cobalamin-binding subunit